MSNSVYEGVTGHTATEIENAHNVVLVNQYSPVSCARSSIAGDDGTRAQIYSGLRKCSCTSKIYALNLQHRLSSKIEDNSKTKHRIF